MNNFVLVTDTGAVRVIRMNRADKKNALNAPMYEAMAQAIESANTSSDIRCIVLAGATGVFCAGNDIDEFRQAAENGTGLDETVIRFLHALARNRKPLVAAVQGVAVGIGTTMLLHCDYVIAADNARFTTPFVGLGLVPEAASSLLAPRVMGQRRAFSLLVMGNTFDAEEAKASGLVNRIAGGHYVEQVAMEAANKIASLPPEAVDSSRALMRGTPDEIIARIDAEADLFRKQLQTDEARAAFAAFFARKK